jgi:hypothetical protein
MNIIVLGRGPSINLYDRNKLMKLCRNSFVLACNDAGLDFPCDVIVALDPDWIKSHVDELKRLRKPIITRKWEHLIDLGLPLIELPNEIADLCRLSGMAAARIGDVLAQITNTSSYVLGLDATDKHYDCKETICQPISQIVPISDYARIRCARTVNLGGTLSQIRCWVKKAKLPESTVSNLATRNYMLDFLRRFAGHFFDELMAPK